MSRILNQLKNARKDGKTPPPNYDATSLDTIIEHNTPGRPKGSNLKRLIIILSIGIGLALIAAFTASYLITHKKRSTHSRLSSAVKEAGEPGPEGLVRRASSEVGWQGLASKELAAKKSETLLVEILSIEGIDEGPIIEDIELGVAPSKEPEEPPVAPFEIETVELVPAPAAPLEIEIVELAPPPVEKPEEVPPTPALPKVVKPEKPEAPRIEIKVEEPEVPERPAAVTVEVPPTVVIEPPAVGAEAPPAPVSPAVLGKKAEPSRIEIRTAPERAPKEPMIPSPPAKVFEEAAIEIQPSAVTEAPRPPAAAPPPAKPREELELEEEGVFSPEVLEKRERFKLAVFHQKSGDLRKAKQQYLEIIKLDPMDPETHNNLGSIYQEWGDLDNAINEYRKAILLRPNYYKARNNLGVALYRKGNFQAALREFQIAVEANPRDIQSLTNLGVISKQLGQLDRARQFFERALSINPAHAEAHYNLALILEQNEPASAVFHYQKFLEYSGGRYPALEGDVMRHLNSLSKMSKWYSPIVEQYERSTQK